MVLRALVQVDRFFVQERGRRELVHLADDAGAPGHVDDDDVVGIGAAQADAFRGKRVGAPVPGIPGLVDGAIFFENAQQLGDGRLPKGFAVGEGQLEGRRLQMGAQDQQVVGIDQPLFRVEAQEILWVVHQVLIERAARRDIDRGCGAAPATGATDLLPGAGDRSRITAQHGGIEMPDVDAELQRVGTDHAPHRSVAQAVLDLASLQREIPTAIAANRA